MSHKPTDAPEASGWHPEHTIRFAYLDHDGDTYESVTLEIVGALARIQGVLSSRRHVDFVVPVASLGLGTLLK